MAASSGFHYPVQLGSRMLPTDALFWYVEGATPELRPLVAGLLMLDRRPERERLRASVERWVARLPRLRQRVVEAPLRLSLPEWEEDAHFDLDYHARQVILPNQRPSVTCWISPGPCSRRPSITCGRCGRRT